MHSCTALRRKKVRRQLAFEIWLLPDITKSTTSECRQTYRLQTGTKAKTKIYNCFCKSMVAYKNFLIKVILRRNPSRPPRNTQRVLCFLLLHESNFISTKKSIMITAPLQSLEHLSTGKPNTKLVVIVQILGTSKWQLWWILELDRNRDELEPTTGQSHKRQNIFKLKGRQSC